MENIRSKIEKKKAYQDNIIDFLAEELSKNNLTSEDYLKKLSDLVQVPYLTRQEFLDILNKKVDTINKERSDTKTQPHEEGQINLKDHSVNYEIRTIINNLEKNRDLSSLKDPVLHFSSGHLNIAKRVFDLQIVQNYLAAIKYKIIDDLTNKQTQFNYATEEAIKNLAEILNKFKREDEIAITELRNYARDSESWIHNDEIKVQKIQEKIETDIENLHTIVKNNTEKITRNVSIINKNSEQLKSIFDNSNTISKKYQELSSALHQHETALTELKNYAKESESWIHKDEAKLETLKNEIDNLQKLIISRDVKTTEFLLEKISHLEEILKKHGLS